MKVLFMSFTILILLLTGIFAQDLIVDEKKLNFEFDYARFRTNSPDFIFFEIYYSVFRSQLKFVPSDGKYEATFTASLKIFNNDSLLYDKDSRSVTRAANMDNVTDSQKIANVIPVIIQPGKYRIELKISDENSDLYGNISKEVEIDSISATQLSMSDIELASLIADGEKKTIFSKGNKQVIPNPGIMYGSGSPMLYSYLEIYNLAEEGEKNQYNCKISIIDGNGNVARLVQDKAKDKPGTSSVEIFGMNIMTLRSGPYFLRYDIHDLDSGQKANLLKKFYVYRAEDFRKTDTEKEFVLDVSNYINAPEYQIYDGMTEEELVSEFNGASYITAKNDKNVFKELDLKGKRKFMKEFWLARDYDRTTMLNEYRRDYLKRLDYVNRYFGSGKPGWKADRGRVMLIYGEPDEVDRYPQGRSKPYEIWKYYELEGGAMFVFIDMTGLGEYTLVHSTVTREIQDYEWQQWLTGIDRSGR